METLIDGVISVWATASSAGFGPMQRARLLLRGLEELGQRFAVGDLTAPYKAILQPVPRETIFHTAMDPHALIGPNLIHTPTEDRELVARYTNFLVQSEWVADLWRWSDARACEGKVFHVWRAGIDTAYWAPGTDRPTHDCLYYVKYQNQENRARARGMLDARGVQIIELKYGEHNATDLLAAAQSCRYAVFHSCCEKSPHALLEIMACGLPVFVLDAKRWIGDDKFDRATSAPYFDDTCGVKCPPDEDAHPEQAFERFREKLGTYRPREFVEHGFTYLDSTREFIGAVRKAYAI